MAYVLTAGTYMYMRKKIELIDFILFEFSPEGEIPHLICISKRAKQPGHITSERERERAALGNVTSTTGGGGRHATETAEPNSQHDQQAH